MAGNIRCLINARFAPDLSWKREQERFVCLYKFFVLLADGGNGPVEIYASNYGSTTTTDGYTNPPGTGFDYWDEANPAGHGAFFVVRFKSVGQLGTTTTRTHSYYLLFQFNRSGYGWGYPGGGGAGPMPAGCLPYQWARSDANQYSQVDVAMAFGDNAGADLDPWGGATHNADGADAKGSTVWANAVTAIAFPRANGPGGDCATHKECVSSIIGAYYQRAGDTRVPSRMELRCDDDLFTIFTDESDTGYWNASVYGPYTPARGTTIATPFVMIQYGLGRFTAGSANVDRNNPFQGGVSQRDLSLGCRNFTVPGIWDVFYTAAQQPTTQTDPASCACYPYELATNENTSFRGQLGSIDTDLIRETNQCSTLGMNAASTRIVMGWNGDPASPKPLTVWPGPTYTFGAGVTRNGTVVVVTP